MDIRPEHLAAAAALVGFLAVGGATLAGAQEAPATTDGSTTHQPSAADDPTPNTAPDDPTPSTSPGADATAPDGCDHDGTRSGTGADSSSGSSTSGTPDPSSL